MSLTSLDFGALPGGRLAFGEGAGPVGPAPVDVSLDADIGALESLLSLGGGRAFSIDSDIGALDAALGVFWDAGVSRGFTHRARFGWQDGTEAVYAAEAHFQDSKAVAVVRASRWQNGAPSPSAAAAAWQDSRPERGHAAAAWQDAARIRARASSAWQDGIQRRAAQAPRWQDGSPVRRAALHQWQEMERLRRTLAERWQEGAAVRHLRREDGRDGTPVRRQASTRWQDARKPPPGRSWRVIPPPPKHLCYDPADLGKLQFGLDTSAPGVLAFWCNHADDGHPRATVTVLRRRSYIVLTSLEVVRADTAQPLPVLVDGFSMRLDRGSWTWGFSLNVHAAALPLLQPDADGLPRELEVRVNGQPFRMLAESRARSVQHPRSVLRVGGRGKAALLDAPFADVRTFTQPTERTAQQIALDVLTVNGVSNGWAVDWGLADWPVPAGTWAHRGTWISALADIAASVGGYLQPHDTDAVLRVLPGYPVRSWELASATPDIELPPGIATVEEVEWVNKPVYDALYMQGEPGNALYYRKRAGTAGEKLASMAVHALLVHADAAAQRAIADLSDTGRQVTQKLTLPVLPQTGVIRPGQLLRYTDDADVLRTGVVRGVAVNAGPARIEQVLEVQAHE
ncbi:hypothetical protein [Ottowia sp. SB7-C50]|uniref:hypothetical protein n=1 Tax=Ottowia sp. SB7-C50 TaxID=3081231 RepID=UPI0029536E8F|nr:hypothetical protein [Ottowia sp. SB7-C50]WOP15760.1 hypothetical protein R0D99_01400 [Ottowia sp. SB7-C50]